MLNRTDYIYLFLLFILLIFGFIVFSGTIVSIYSDIGREFYVPWQMNEGQVLYKDIFNVYPPLGYQLNAFILKIFSNNINSLFYMGLVSSILAISAIYLISKEYMNNILALLVGSFIIFSCVYYPYISNYISPYSYSVLYAMVAFLWAFFFLVKYFKTEKINLFYISCLLYGMSVCFKYEYLLFGFVLIGTMYYKKIPVKKVLLSFFSIILVPVLSLINLFIQGCKINDLTVALKDIMSLSSANSVTAFYTNVGFIPSVPTFVAAMKSLFFFFLFCLIIFFYSNFIISRKFSGIVKIILLIPIPVFVILILPFHYAVSNAHFLGFGYLSIVILLINLFRKIENKELLLLLNITAILSCFKCFGAISLSIYGTFFLPILLVNLIASVDSKKYLIPLCCVLVSIIYLYVKEDVYKFNLWKTDNFKISEKLYSDNNYFSKRYSELIPYINANIKPDEKLLVLPEGCMLNYLTKIKSDNKLYYLIPPNVDVFSQNGIIERLRENMPEYIIVFSNYYVWYNTTTFANGYGVEIQKFIEDNYNIVEEASGKYDKMYKLKEI